MLENDKESGRRAFLRSILAGTGATVLGLSGCALDGEKSPGERDLVDSMDRARALFAFKPGVTYLNNGSLGSCPGPVHEAMVRAMRSVDANPTRVFWNDLLPVVDTVRESAAHLIRATPEEVAVVRNTTEGMNIVASGLALRKNDEILTTTREHDGGFLCWKYLSERMGIRIRKFTPPTPPEDPGVLVDLVKMNLTPATRVVSLCHMVSPTGLVFPLKEISKIVRPRGIFLVADGAHPPGQMRVDVRALGVDTYASSSHKWLCAPRGTGLLYVRREVQDEIRPLIAGSRDYRRPDARRYEACGTRSLEALVGLKAALDLCENVGPDRIEARIRFLSSRLRTAIRGMRGIRLLTSEKPDLSCGLTAVGFKVVDRCRVQQHLWDRLKIWVKPLPEPDLNAIRISTHYYNTPEDVDRLIRGLEAVV